MSILASSMILKSFQNGPIIIKLSLWYSQKLHQEYCRVLQMSKVLQTAAKIIHDVNDVRCFLQKKKSYEILQLSSESIFIFHISPNHETYVSCHSL